MHNVVVLWHCVINCCDFYKCDHAHKQITPPITSHESHRMRIVREEADINSLITINSGRSVNAGCQDICTVLLLQISFLKIF